MRINRITMTNFRCYYGTNEIVFNNEGKITLICGLSGHGKSSLLNFFRWMFYGDPDFGRHNDKQLFNELAYSEKKAGETLELKGDILFEHLGVKYSLIKKIKYKVGSSLYAYKIESEERSLYSLINDNWEPFVGNIQNKINSIMPHGLSKYFFLAGERAVETVLDSYELRRAIHTLFDLDKYENALMHLGKELQKKSLIGHYHSLMLKEMTNVAFDKSYSLSRLQEDLSDVNDQIELLKQQRKDALLEHNKATVEKEEILKIIGKESNRSNLTQIISMDNQQIKFNDQQIISYKRAIGNLIYKNFPYLLLSKKTGESSSYLRAKNEELLKNNSTYYQHLRKELLSEILQKGVCICGKDIDHSAIECINNTISTMPPNSLTYLFGQFVTSSKENIKNAREGITKYQNIMDKINHLHLENHNLELDIKDKESEIKKLDEAKSYLNRLEELNSIIAKKNKEISSYNGELRLKEEMFSRGNNELKKMKQNATISDLYSRKINFLNSVKSELEKEKINYENKIKNTINESVRYMFKALTTQTAIDPNTIQFIKEDFSLRTTFLTGGQLAVEVYSYIIGITKALQELNVDTNENPIIIDAPFAFTDALQSDHLVRALPKFSKQTVLLTLDISKILKNLENETSNYEIYLIDTDDSQLKSVVRKSTLQEIKEEMLNK